MGTSGAYGGSGSAGWSSAHQIYGQGAAGRTPPPADVVQAFARAMLRGNRNVSSGPGVYTAGSTGPTRRSGSEGFARSRSSRTGGGGLSRRAARGAAAVAGAQAYRTRDAQALAELGLDLVALDALPNDRSRCAAITEQLLGAPTHPEDAALNAVSIQTMMDLLRSPDDPDSEAIIERFTVNLAYEQALVELTSQQRTDPLPAKQAAMIERQAKRYIENSLRTEVSRTSGRLGAQALIDKAAGLASRVLDIFGRRR